MLNWFREIAPIRTKMRLLNVAFTGLGLGSAIGVAAAIMAGAHAAAVAVALGMALLTATFGIICGRAITEPYVTTVVRMEGLASGDLSSPVLFGGFKDCVGRMTRAMAVFRDTAEACQRSEAAQAEVVASMTDALRQFSEGHLWVRLDTPFAPAYEPLRRDFNAAVAAMADMLDSVTAATLAINSGSTEISQASDDLSRRTEQQAASLEETAAAMTEITATVRETASGAVRANDLVSRTRSDAEDGGRIVREAVDAMGRIERASNEISEIISVIDGIAFQTNLLALNAGVEAARAGDAGRGFAVVASEVRALAQRSADAARDVKAKITGSAGQVDIGVSLVGDTGRSLERIVNRIAEVSTLVATIATSAEQQAAGLRQVNTAVGEMDSITQQNAAMVEESTAAARSLAAEAQDLAQQISRFELRQGGRPALPPDPAHPIGTRRATQHAHVPAARSPRTSGALALSL